MQHISYKFRAYPNKTQQQTLGQWLGCGRYVWNKMLELNKQKYVDEKKFAFHTEMANKLPGMKQELEWLSLVPSQALQQKCIDLSGAIGKKFKSGFGFPRFKSKHTDQSGIRFPQGWHISGNRINLPKMKGIKFKQHREIVGNMSSLTLKRDCVGDYWITILCSVPLPEQITDIKTQRVVGIDVGLKEFAVTSDGQIIKNPKYLRKSEQVLKTKQRNLSRKVKGSNNRIKSRIILAKQHRKIRNQRLNFVNQFVSSITKDYDVVCTEDLNITGMKQNHCLAKSIGDVGWGLMYSKMTQKCHSLGKIMLKVDQFAPTSKTCSCCGSVQSMPLQVRIFDCYECGSVLDRDFNAAVNIKNWALEKHRLGTNQINACGNMILNRESAQEASATEGGTTR
ncbi:MAG: RNA-guided endonuclease InsQ/TnpB family protein [Nitrosopumilaceae archaeon]